MIRKYSVLTALIAFSFLFFSCDSLNSDKEHEDHNAARCKGAREGFLLCTLLNPNEIYSATETGFCDPFYIATLGFCGSSAKSSTSSSR
ncbi:hypothetical protein CH379_003250 [Leptospira ellisii]|uniref:Lipoprotein n=1 Tax=Leptospira ellisii TaxID=2023197 RepID=A0AAE4QLP1_9LEPT|nr:hypothetical protein [Leptospira ellisii]MDV6234644.1 hypothetical protein [Leptospira ellisii]PKA05726.1 hypothetical protein CH375_03510 [Leptospira ellisii]